MMAFAKSLKKTDPVSTAVKLLQAGLLLLTGWILTRAVLLLVNPESAWTPLPQVSSILTNESGEVVRDYDFSTDPFRLAKSEAIASAVFLDPGFDVPETQLNLILKGRTVGNPGSAVLQTPDNKESSYREGDEVMSGVTLQSVSSDFVVLDVRGERERLTFSREERTALGLSNQESAQSVNDSMNVAVEVTGPQLIPTVNALNASDLLNAVRLNPKFDKGQLTGYVIQSTGDETLLKNYGLQSGDIVTALNGESLLQGPPDLRSLQQTLSRARQVRLDVIRDGRPQTVKIGQ